jgi:hypothetical protein
VGVLAEALDPLSDVGREGRQASGSDVPALAGELAQDGGHVERGVEDHAVGEQRVELSWSAGSLRSIASCQNHSQAEKPS